MRMTLNRILLVCGQQNAGKSYLIRRTLEDVRLGGGGSVSLTDRGRPRLQKTVAERWLVTLLSSPHEYGDTPKSYHERIKTRCVQACRHSSAGIDLVSAIQPNPFKNMPDIAHVCAGLIGAFSPAQIRVAVLDPDQHGAHSTAISAAQQNSLTELGVSVIFLDATRGRFETQNRNTLCDFLIR